jgi:enolase
MLIIKNYIKSELYMEIKNIRAIRVLDSRGVPTIKTYVFTENEVGSASVPSGTSAGLYEAYELRDKNSKDFFKQDVLKAINNVNNIISKKLKGKFILDQDDIDKTLIELDGTLNKSKLGANAILSVSLACSRAASKELSMPLYKYISRLIKNEKYSFPTPLLNIINGGLHSGSKIAFQEYLIIPKFNDFEKSIKAASEIYHFLKEIILKKHGSSSTNVGYEGGFVPNFKDADEERPLVLIEEAILKAGYTRKDIGLGLDCAANSFYNEKNKKYFLNDKNYSSSELSDYYFKLIKDYKIISIEDPFFEEDKLAWKNFNKKQNNKINVIGDDLLVTNPKLIKDAIKNKYCNSLLLKVNQIGTLTESLESFSIARKADWKVVVSHRSGETEDTFISDFSYGINSDFIKFGAPSRGERTSKYNRLLEIKAIDI